MTQEGFAEKCKEILNQEDYNKVEVKLMSIPPRNRKVAVALLKLGCEPNKVASFHHKVVRAVREGYGDIQPKKKKKT